MRSIEMETSRIDIRVRHHNMKACDAFDVMAQVQHLTCPTLAMCSFDDVITPLKFTEYFKANLPHCSLELILDAGHWVPVEQAEKVNAAIAAFLWTLQAGMSRHGGWWMIIDMHVHSDVSDDGMASVETYMKWITRLRRNYRIDGIVFTEHRLFNSDADYDALAREYDILILKGTEADTDCGHVLLYGVNEKVLGSFDFRNVHLSGRDLINAMEDTGGIGIPAHPGRRYIGLVEHLEKGYDIGTSLRAAEQLNGGSSKQENARAHQLVEDRKLFGTGGSDAHFVSAVGKFMTQFKRPIRTMQDLVEQLYSGGYRPITLEDARIQA